MGRRLDRRVARVTGDSRRIGIGAASAREVHLADPAAAAAIDRGGDERSGAIGVLANDAAHSETGDIACVDAARLDVPASDDAEWLSGLILRSRGGS